MFKPSCRYCYALGCVPGLKAKKNYLRTSPKICLKDGWVSVRNRVWEIVWESSCNTRHLQSFGISLLTKWSLEKEVKKSEKKICSHCGIPTASEHIITCLLQGWNKGTSGLELESKASKQVRINHSIGKGKDRNKGATLGINLVEDQEELSA